MPVRSRRRLAVAVLIVAAAAAVVYAIVEHRRDRPVLPSLNMQGVDPIVAAAVEEAQAGVRASPSSAEAWGRLGQVLYVHGLNSPAAAEAFARAAALSRADPRWTYLRGRTLKREDGDAAIPDLRRAADLCKGDPPAPGLTLAELLIERGRLVPARAELERVTSRHTADARALLDRARLEAASGDVDAALANVTASLHLAPQVKASRLLLASLLARRGDRDAAAREARRAQGLSDDPDWPDPYVEEMAHLAVGKVAAIQQSRRMRVAGHAREAADLMRGISGEYPNDAEVELALAEAARDAGSMAEAEAAYRQALNYDPALNEARVGLGQLLARQGKYADALQLARDALRQNAGLASAHFLAGVCDAKLGDPGRAADELRAVIALQPSNRESYVALAAALIDQGKPEEAVKELHRAVDLDPEAPDAAALRAQMDLLERQVRR